MKNKGITLIVLSSLLALTGCAGASKSKGTITIGSKDFTENEIVAEVYALALEDAGYKVNCKMDIASSVIHTSIVNKQIDLYPEYTGTGLITILKHKPVNDPQQVYNIVKSQYNKKYKITWLNYAKANDGQGIFVSKRISDKYHIKTLSDLQKNASHVRFASQGEFDQRSDGLPALNKTYGTFKFKSSKVYDNGLKYQVVDSNKADAAPAYTTEGQLSQTQKFVLLTDDKKVWPPYNIAPIVRSSVLNKHSDIKTILNKISKHLDTKTVTKLNAKVDISKQDYEDVAEDFYDSIKG